MFISTNEIIYALVGLLTYAVFIKYDLEFVVAGEGKIWYGTLTKGSIFAMMLFWPVVILLHIVYLINKLYKKKKFKHERR